MGPPDFIQGAIFLRSTHQAARMSSHDQQKLALASATTGPTIFMWSTPQTSAISCFDLDGDTEQPRDGETELPSKIKKSIRH